MTTQHIEQREEIGATGPDFFNEQPTRRFHAQVASRLEEPYLAESSTTPFEEISGEVRALLGMYAISRTKKASVPHIIDEMTLILEVGTEQAAERIGKTKINLENRKLQVAKASAEVLTRYMNGEDVEVRTAAPKLPVERTSHAEQSRVYRSAQPVPIDRYVGSDYVKMHMQDVGQHEVLAAEAEVELAKRIEAGLLAGKILAGDMPNTLKVSKEELLYFINDGQAAKDKFITSNLRLVVSWVNKNRPTFGDKDVLADRIQMGYLGLIRAVEKFDFTKGTKFSTYATPWIRQFVDRERANTERMVRLPAEVETQLQAVKKAREELQKEKHRQPTTSELSEAVGFDVAELEAKVRFALGVISYNTPVGEDGAELIDVLAEKAS